MAVLKLWKHFGMPTYLIVQSLNWSDKIKFILNELRSELLSSSSFQTENFKFYVPREQTP